MYSHFLVCNSLGESMAFLSEGPIVILEDLVLVHQRSLLMSKNLVFPGKTLTFAVELVVYFCQTLFLAGKEFVLPRERVVNVLEFPAFAYQTAVLLLEASFRVCEALVCALEVAVLSQEGLVLALELRVLTPKRIHIFLDRGEHGTITDGKITGFEFIDELSGRRSGTRLYDEMEEVRYLIIENSLTRFAQPVVARHVCGGDGGGGGDDDDGDGGARRCHRGWVDRVWVQQRWVQWQQQRERMQWRA